jgi:hypothetical protein
VVALAPPAVFENWATVTGVLFPEAEVGGAENTID